MFTSLKIISRIEIFEYVIIIFQHKCPNSYNYETPSNNLFVAGQISENVEKVIN
jgi:hypothetical protein